MKAHFEQVVNIEANYYKYWTRYFNEGTLIQFNLTWEGIRFVEFSICIPFSEIKNIIKKNCLVNLKSKKQILFDFTVKTSSGYTIILENLYQDPISYEIDIVSGNTLSDNSKFELKEKKQIIEAKVIFDMHLIQYETEQSKDLYVGTFIKYLNFLSIQRLVLQNPSTNIASHITLIQTLRLTEGYILLSFIQILIISLHLFIFAKVSNVEEERKNE